DLHVIRVGRNLYKPRPIRDVKANRLDALPVEFRDPCEIRVLPCGRINLRGPSIEQGFHEREPDPAIGSGDQSYRSVYMHIDDSLETVCPKPYKQVRKSRVPLTLLAGLRCHTTNFAETSRLSRTYKPRLQSNIPTLKGIFCWARRLRLSQRERP